MICVMPGILGVIPARYASTRFPGKPLALIAGVPLVIRVLRNALSAKSITRVLVATDDARIADVVRKNGGEAMMTSPEHRSGTDRLAEVLKKSPEAYAVNLQGDEPLLGPEVLDRTVDAFLHSGLPCGTLSVPLNPEEAPRPDVVKVVSTPAGRALYFSRAPLAGAFQHVGLYLYKRAAAISFSQLPLGRLEQAENLEQLRLLENGFDIYVHQDQVELLGVDRPEDVARVEALLTKRGMV